MIIFILKYTILKYNYIILIYTVELENYGDLS